MVDSEEKNKDDYQKERMEEPVTRDNCWEKLILIRTASGMSRKELAKVLGCSESTLARLEKGDKKGDKEGDKEGGKEGGTKPTDDFLLRLAALCQIGFHKYSKMSEAEKEKLSEVIGASGGVLAGVGGAIAAVSASGAVAGLSAAGITSGLAAIGGGAMLGGLAVVAAIPTAVGFAGYGLVKGIKKICEANRLSCKEVDGKYEIRPMPEESKGDE